MAAAVTITELGIATGAYAPALAGEPHEQIPAAVRAQVPHRAVALHTAFH